MKHVKQSEKLAVLEVLIVWCVQYVLEKSRRRQTEVSWKKLQEKVRQVSSER